MHIQDIPQKFVPTLAKLLQFRPNEGPQALAQRLAEGAKTLPSSLRSSRLENLLLPARGHLCQLHKCIHYDVVRAVLHHVQLEVGYRLNDVVSESGMLAPEQYTRILRLRELHALWLDRSQYRRTFKSRVQDLKWKYQTDQCGACTLSQITSDLQILLDLRWAFRSRATRAFEAKYGNPRLQQWCNSWIATLASFVEAATNIEIDLDAVLLHNDLEAIELKKLRVQVATKKQLDKDRRGGPLDGAYVTEVPTGYSYPIRFAPHPPKLQATPEALETLEIQAENFVGDADEVHLEGIDPYEALTSTTYLPSTANPQQVRQPSTSADRSTTGHDPHPSSQSARCSTATVSIMLDDRPHVAQEYGEYSTVVKEYIPPRSQWKRPVPQEAARASSTLLPSPTTVRARPLSVTSKDTGERSTVSSQSSWQTEICQPEDVSSSIYSTPTLNTQATPSQSYLNLSRVAQEQARTRNPLPRRRQAESYTNLLPDTPFSDSSNTLRSSRAQKSEADKLNQVRSPAKESARSPGDSASTLFLNLYSEIRRPVDPGTSIRTHHRNSSATTLRQADVTPSAVSPPDSPTTPRASKAPRPTSVTSEAEFTQMYSEIVEGYMYNPGMASVATSTSTMTRQKLTPQPLVPEKLPTQTKTKTEHDEEVSRIVADITRGANLDNPNEDNCSKRSRKTRNPTPSLVSATTISSDRADSVSTQRKRSSMQSGRSKQIRPEGKGGGTGSDKSQQTTWSGGYQDHVEKREDLGWYYGKDKDSRKA